MKFYDLHVQSNLSGGESSIEDLASFAEKLGFSGIAICENFQNIEKLEEFKQKLKDLQTGIEVYDGLVIQAKDVNELKNTIDRVREEVLIVIVSGGDYLINRAACENPKVDILAHPELGRADSGLDEYCINKARENNVAIQVNFREILYSYRKPRSYILNHIQKNVKLGDSLRAPLVICSGAQSTWDMRGPRELVSIANILGLDVGKAFNAITTLPQQMIENNKKTLEGKIITEGVERVD